MAKKWYAVHTYSGFENKVKKSLEGRARQDKLEEQLGEILIPMEQVVEMVTDVKSWLWMGIALLVSIPSGGINTFGPLIIKGFGFSGSVIGCFFFFLLQVD